MTLQGLRPAAVAPLVGIMLYYPDRDFPAIQRNRMRPALNGGRDGSRGLQIFFERISQSQKIVNPHVFIAGLQHEQINPLPQNRTGMLVLSPAMEAYEKSLMDDLFIAIAIAKKARARGLDPSTDIEIPIASDLADRVEALLGIKGVAVRIRELESQMSREEVALRIGDDFVARKFGETTDLQILDHAIRTAMALLTEGVVAAPTEGIAKIGLGKNDDGSQYLKIFYAGPIRSAGGTAQALSVLVG